MNEMFAIVTEIRDCGTRLTDAADTLAELFSGTGDAPVKPAAPEPKPVTLEQVRAVLASLSRDGHTAAVRSLLEKHGAARLSEIEPGEYASLLTDAEALI